MCKLKSNNARNHLKVAEKRWTLQPCTIFYLSCRLYGVKYEENILLYLNFSAMSSCNILQTCKERSLILILNCPEKWKMLQYCSFAFVLHDSYMKKAMPLFQMRYKSSRFRQWMAFRFRTFTVRMKKFWVERCWFEERYVKFYVLLSACIEISADRFSRLWM